MSSEQSSQQGFLCLADGTKFHFDGRNMSGCQTIFSSAMQSAHSAEFGERHVPRQAIAHRGQRRRRSRECRSRRGGQPRLRRGLSACGDGPSPCRASVSLRMTDGGDSAGTLTFTNVSFCLRLPSAICNEADAQQDEGTSLHAEGTVGSTSADCSGASAVNVTTGAVSIKSLGAPVKSRGEHAFPETLGDVKGTATFSRRVCPLTLLSLRCCAFDIAGVSRKACSAGDFTGASGDVIDTSPVVTLAAAEEACAAVADCFSDFGSSHRSEHMDSHVHNVDAGVEAEIEEEAISPVSSLHLDCFFFNFPSTLASTLCT